MSTTQTHESASLDEVLAYRNPAVVRRYVKDHGGTHQEAELVFREALKWLYLCWRGWQDGLGCAMHPELEKIDRMWHTFVLFTLDYSDFCERHFGLFIHHVPNEAEDEAPLDEEEVRTHLTRQLTLVCDVLGEDTLAAWYDECRYAVPA